VHATTTSRYLSTSRPLNESRHKVRYGGVRSRGSAAELLAVGGGAADVARPVPRCRRRSLPSLSHLLPQPRVRAGLALSTAICPLATRGSQSALNMQEHVCSCTCACASRRAPHEHRASSAVARPPRTSCARARPPPRVLLLALYDRSSARPQTSSSASAPRPPLVLLRRLCMCVCVCVRVCVCVHRARAAPLLRASFRVSRPLRVLSRPSASAPAPSRACACVCVCIASRVSSSSLRRALLLRASSRVLPRPP